MEAAVIIERTLPFWYAVIICGLFYSFITTWDGKTVRGFSVAIVVVSLTILLTDLRKEHDYASRNFNFNGVVYLELDEVKFNMPVLFDEICNTGVITGGYEDVENSIHSI